MAAYRRVYDSRHLQADCQEPGSAPEPYARMSTMGCLYLFLPCYASSVCAVIRCPSVHDKQYCIEITEQIELVLVWGCYKEIWVSPKHQRISLWDFVANSRLENFAMLSSTATLILPYVFLCEQHHIDKNVSVDCVIVCATRGYVNAANLWVA